MRLTRVVLWQALAVCIGAFTLFMISRRFDGAHALLLPTGEPLFGDFLNFWTGGKFATLGRIDILYDEAANRAFQHALLPGYTGALPYYEPPPFLLLMAPLSLLGYAPAGVVFLVLSLAVFALAAWRLAPDRRALVFVAAYPVVFTHLGNLQTGLLLSGMTGLALYWLDRRPRCAGLAIACLIVKPHLALAWPIMLAVQGRWQTFLAAAAGVLGLSLAAGLIFGFEVYAGFLHNLQSAQGSIDALRTNRHLYASLYANLLVGGAPGALATGLHVLSACAALAAAWAIWRRGDGAASGAALCAASVLLSPYLFFYDMPLTGVGALLIAQGALSRPTQYALAYIWIAPLLAITFAGEGFLPFCPIAGWTLMALAAQRAFAPARPQASAP